MLTCAFRAHVKHSTNGKNLLKKIIFNILNNKLIQFPKQILLVELLTYDLRAQVNIFQKENFLIY